MLIFLVTNLVVLPVSIAFFYDDVGVHWIVFNISCDTMFILDIIINFRTGEAKLKKIVKLLSVTVSGLIDYIIHITH